MATSYRFPKAFITEHVMLTWRDMLYGLERGFLDEMTVQQLAADKVTLQSGPESPEMRIALMDRDDLPDVRDVLAAAAKGENAESDRDRERKWCFLVLQWLFDHREDVADPLSEIENIYADFGYPPEVAPFVRYEPTPIGAREPADPRDRLVGRWATYLAALEAEFGPGYKT
jgi:hypothetical protein